VDVNEGITLAQSVTAGPPGREDHSLLRREMGRLDTVFFLISAMVVMDTIGAIAIAGAQAFTWLVVLFVLFFVPTAFISAELGAAIPEEGGAYVWVSRAFGRFWGALTSLLYWAGTPVWLGGSVTVVAIAVVEGFFAPLARPGAYAVGGVLIVVATIAAVVPLRVGKWVPTSGAVAQIALLTFFVVSVGVYAARHGVHGIQPQEFTPSTAVLIGVVPVLLYSFVGVELPTTAAEEMRDPQRDIPVAIGQAGVALAVMYAVPVLAVLLVLPAERITTLHGLTDALKSVLTVYGGEVHADGSVILRGAGLWLGWATAAVFLWVLLSSGTTWIMGASRAQSAACLDGAGPRSLGRISGRTGVPVVMALVSGGLALLTMTVDLTVTGGNTQRYFSAALTLSIALIVLAYLMIFPAFLRLRRTEAALHRPVRVPGGRPGALLVTALSTGWSALVAGCLLWPGLGTADPNRHLPPGFAGERLMFEALVLTPIVGVVLVVTLYLRLTRTGK
jgi:amino acid transporter